MKYLLLDFCGQPIKFNIWYVVDSKEHWWFKYINFRSVSYTKNECNVTYIGVVTDSILNAPIVAHSLTVGKMIASKVVETTEEQVALYKILNGIA